MKRLERLLQVLRKRRRVVVGLTSQGSLSGIEAALVEIEGGGEGASVRLLSRGCYPYPRGLQHRLLRLYDPDRARIEEVCRADFLVGELFAEAVRRLLEQASFSTAGVDLIGAAGPTLWQDPEPVALEVEVAWAGELLMTRSTTSLGQSAVIAERTGVLTVGDLRLRDVAAGGRGGPLMAYPDWVLLRHPRHGRCVLTLAGTACLTYLPPGATRRDVVALETGPGGAALDALIEMSAAGREPDERDAGLAAAGRVRWKLLEEWLDDPFFACPPPRPAVGERFGALFAHQVVARFPRIPLADLAATLTSLVAETVAIASERFLLPAGRLHEVVVGGSGAGNPTLMGRLRERLRGLNVVACEERGLESRSREAVGVAILANDALRGLETNLTGATGGRGTVLGKVSL
jgi:anhydro-N-acetylmuramic acid kinase